MTQVFSDRIDALRKALGYNDKLRIVDVGANPMQHDTPYKLLHGYGHAVVTGFDPQAETLSALKEESSDEDRFLPYAIGDGRSHELNIYKGSGLTSLLKIRRKTLFYLMGLKRAAELQGTEQMATHKLDDLDQISRMDLLKIDIQGAETMVFDHGMTKIGTAVAVHTEVNFFPLYEGQPSFGDVDVALRKAGFVPHSFYHTVKRFVRSGLSRTVEGLKPSHLLDGDIVYFRDLSAADDLSVDQLARMALIADGIYGFYDYALRCVEEIGKKKRINEEDVARYVDGLNATIGSQKEAD